MKPERINQLIAEHCGKKYHKPTSEEIKSGSYYQYEPNFYNDLNAMHEAEATLNGIAKEEYCCFLISESIENSSRWDCAHATAAQRAEAFLLTVGKWEDV